MNEYQSEWDDYRARLFLHNAQRAEEKRSLRRQSNRAGLCVIAFLILQYAVALILARSPALLALNIGSEAARGLIDMFRYLICMFAPFLVAFLVMRPEDKSALTLFGKPTSKPAAIAAVGAGYLVCTAANYVTNMLLILLENSGVTAGGGTYAAPKSGVQLVFCAVSVGILPAFTEEFALRGIVMQPLRRFGDRFAILMSALVFGLMHANLSQFVFAFIVGAAIGYFVVATGSVWVGVAIHMLNNLNSVILDGLLETRPTAAEKFYNIELSVSIVVGIMCFALFFAVCRRNKLQKPNNALTVREKTAAYIFTAPMVISIVWLIFETVRLISFEGS